MHDLLKPMIDWDALPRHVVEAGRPIIMGDEPTSLLFLVESGRASGADGRLYCDGEVLSLCEALALDKYDTPIHAETACDLVAISKATLESALKQGGQLAWPLSRSIASDVTRRRMAG